MIRQFEEGDFYTTFIDGSEEVGQNIKSRLQLIQSEWSYNLDEGVAWAEILGVKPINLDLIESVIKERVYSTDDVEYINEFAVEQLGREILVTMEVVTSYGNVTIQDILS